MVAQPRKPLRLWEPSQTGLRPDSPHRHRNTRSPAASWLPSVSRTRTGPVTASGPSGFTWIVNAPSASPLVPSFASAARRAPGPSVPPSDRV